MLRLTGVSVQFGAQFVLRSVDFELGDRDRIAVVGRNGAGKSTLLAVAAGTLAPDEGDRVLGRGEDVGLLRQENTFADGRTLWDEAFEPLRALVGLEAKAQALLAEAGALPGDDPRLPELLHEAEILQERHRLADGHRAEAACGRVLSGLGFTPEDHRKEARLFSGGWRIRIALAKLLLLRPSFLLLDEPTNHLDLETRTWLLHELRRYPGGIAIISHDRDFLDRLVLRTAEVAGGTVRLWPGGWTKFRQARDQAVEQLRKAAEERAEERARIQAFVDRFRAQANKATQVQSRLKLLEKLPPIEVPQLAPVVRLRFPPPPPCQPPALELQGVSRAFGAKAVLRDAYGVVQPGQRVLLVGHNGAGKSTLLRLLAGRLTADAGFVRQGPGVRVAWFAQDQADELPPDGRLLDVVQAADPLRPAAQVRSLLGSLLFDGDAVQKPCGVLSGGEKSRVALARVLLTRANVLLLDEPTNHLDVETQDVLADALGAWPGAIVFVSHDRGFADALAETVWEVSSGSVREHHGGFEDFLWARAEELGLAVRGGPGERAPDAWLLGGGAEVDDAPAPEKKSSWADRKKLAADERKRQRRVEELEAAIAQAETAQAALSASLASPEVAADAERLLALSRTWEAGQAALEALIEQWAEAQG